jgi:hypothetical protein
LWRASGFAVRVMVEARRRNFADLIHSFVDRELPFVGNFSHIIVSRGGRGLDDILELIVFYTITG